MQTHTQTKDIMSKDVYLDICAPVLFSAGKINSAYAVMINKSESKSTSSKKIMDAMKTDAAGLDELLQTIEEEDVKLAQMIQAVLYNPGIHVEINAKYVKKY